MLRPLLVLLEGRQRIGVMNKGCHPANGLTERTGKKLDESVAGNRNQSCLAFVQ